jgi:TATA-binding protein-associated factor Taf7
LQSGDFGRTLQWKRTRVRFRRQKAAHDIGGIDGRVSNFAKQRKTAGVITMAVRQQHRIDRANSVEVGQQARLRPVAKIEQQASFARFEQKARGALAAEA